MISGVIDALSHLFTSEFMPHGHCYFWRPLVLWLNVGSDALIALSYYSIPLSLLVVLRKRDDIRYKRLVFLFAAFIFLCGSTHLFDIWTVWHGTYYIEGILKLCTAIVSLTTAIVFWMLIPKIILIPSRKQLEVEIDARKKVEQELQRVNSILGKKTTRLQREGDIKTQVLIDVSQELRNPISLILAPLQSLLESDAAGVMPENHRKDIELALSSAHHLHYHIEALLEFAAIGNGNFASSFEKVDVIRMSHAIIKLFENRAAESHVELKVTGDEQPCSLYLDITLWEKVMFNLLDNALEFTSEGVIEVDFLVTDTTFAMRVSDTGLSVSQEELDRYFEQNARNSRVIHSRKGFRIGFNFVKEIVLLHGGTISASSNAVQGVTLLIEVPFNENLQVTSSFKDDVYHLSDFLHGFKRSQSEVVKEVDREIVGESHIIKEGTILIVDDSREVLFFISRVLEDRYIIKTAESGEVALKLLEECTPDIILLDLMMPGMGGVDFVEALQTRGLCPQVPIILVTANTDFDSQQEALKRTGAIDLIAKPFHSKALRSVIARRLKESQKIRAREQSLLNRMAAIVNSSSEVIFSIDNRGVIDSWNDGAEQLFGVKRFEAIGVSASKILMNAGDGFDELLTRAVAAEPTTNLELCVRNDVEEKHLLGSVSPIYGEGHEVLGAGVVCSDVTTQREINRHLRLLIAELNHRVKNTLAVVLSIAHKTQEIAGSREEFINSFEGRLKALAMAHSLLTANNWTHTDLSELVLKVLAPYMGQDKTDIDIQGEPVSCNAKQAVALCLLLHEICTNAVKYGALSSCGGSISVRWNMYDEASERKLCISWDEIARKKVVWDSKEGFGSILVRQGVEYELEGSVEENRHEHGVSYRFMFPLTYETGALYGTPTIVG